jgi:hypothetical protein
MVEQQEGGIMEEILYFQPLQRWGEDLVDQRHIIIMPEGLAVLAVVELEAHREVMQLVWEFQDRAIMEEQDTIQLIMAEEEEEELAAAVSLELHLMVAMEELVYPLL